MVSFSNQAVCFLFTGCRNLYTKLVV